MNFSRNIQELKRFQPKDRQQEELPRDLGTQRDEQISLPPPVYVFHKKNDISIHVGWRLEYLPALQEDGQKHISKK